MKNFFYPLATIASKMSFIDEDILNETYSDGGSDSDGDNFESIFFGASSENNEKHSEIGTDKTFDVKENCKRLCESGLCGDSKCKRKCKEECNKSKDPKEYTVFRVSSEKKRNELQQEFKKKYDREMLKHFEQYSKEEEEVVKKKKPPLPPRRKRKMSLEELKLELAKRRGWSYTGNSVKVNFEEKENNENKENLNSMTISPEEYLGICIHDKCPKPVGIKPFWKKKKEKKVEIKFKDIEKEKKKKQKKFCEKDCKKKCPKTFGFKKSKCRKECEKLCHDYGKEQNFDDHYKLKTETEDVKKVSEEVKKAEDDLKKEEDDVKKAEETETELKKKVEERKKKIVEEVEKVKTEESKKIEEEEKKLIEKAEKFIIEEETLEGKKKLKKALEKGKKKLEKEKERNIKEAGNKKRKEIEKRDKKEIEKEKKNLRDQKKQIVKEKRDVKRKQKELKQKELKLRKERKDVLLIIEEERDKKRVDLKSLNDKLAVVNREIEDITPKKEEMVDKANEINTFNEKTRKDFLNLKGTSAGETFVEGQMIHAFKTLFGAYIRGYTKPFEGEKLIGELIGADSDRNFQGCIKKCNVGDDKCEEKCLNTFEKECNEEEKKMKKGETKFIPCDVMVKNKKRQIPRIERVTEEETEEEKKFREEEERIIEKAEEKIRTDKIEEEFSKAYNSYYKEQIDHFSELMVKAADDEEKIKSANEFMENADKENKLYIALEDKFILEKNYNEMVNKTEEINEKHQFLKQRGEVQDFKDALKEYTSGLVLLKKFTLSRNKKDEYEKELEKIWGTKRAPRTDITRRQKLVKTEKLTEKIKKEYEKIKKQVEKIKEKKKPIRVVPPKPIPVVKPVRKFEKENKINTYSKLCNEYERIWSEYCDLVLNKEICKKEKNLVVKVCHENLKRLKGVDDLKVIDDQIKILKKSIEDGKKNIKKEKDLIIYKDKCGEYETLLKKECHLDEAIKDCDQYVTKEIELCTNVIKSPDLLSIDDLKIEITRLQKRIDNVEARIKKLPVSVPVVETLVEFDPELEKLKVEIEKAELHLKSKKEKLENLKQGLEDSKKELLNSRENLKKLFIKTMFNHNEDRQVKRSCDYGKSLTNIFFGVKFKEMYDEKYVIDDITQGRKYFFKNQTKRLASKLLSNDVLDNEIKAIYIVANKMKDNPINTDNHLPLKLKQNTKNFKINLKNQTDDFLKLKNDFEKSFKTVERLYTDEAIATTLYKFENVPTFRDLEKLNERNAKRKDKSLEDLLEEENKKYRTGTLSLYGRNVRNYHIYKEEHNKIQGELKDYLGDKLFVPSVLYF